MTFVLEYRYPVAINVDRIDYNMVYRWEQIAICQDRKPLQDWINKQETPDDYRIDEYPC